MGAKGASRLAEYALLILLMGIIGAVVLRWHIVAEKREVAQLVRTLKRIDR